MYHHIKIRISLCWTSLKIRTRICHIASLENATIIDINTILIQLTYLNVYFVTENGYLDDMHVYSVKNGHRTMIFTHKFRVTAIPNYGSWFFILVLNQNFWSSEQFIFSQKLSKTDKISFSNDILLKKWSPVQNLDVKSDGI